MTVLLMLLLHWEWSGCIYSVSDLLLLSIEACLRAEFISNLCACTPKPNKLLPTSQIFTNNQNLLPKLTNKLHTADKEAHTADWSRPQSQSQGYTDRVPATASANYDAQLQKPVLQGRAKEIKKLPR